MECRDKPDHHLHKRKIKIGISEMKKKEKKGHTRYKTDSYSQKCQFDKLLDITTRCVDYYNKFIDEKNTELSIVTTAFGEIHNNLDNAFHGILDQVKNKHLQIKQFLASKEDELKKIKQEQEDSLKQTLEQVKSVHLKNLLQDYEPGDSSLSVELSSFSETLHKFYTVIEDIQKVSFKDGVDETINFINNLIAEEIRIIVCQRIPQKSMNCSFSFNDEKLFENSEQRLLESMIGAKNKEIKDFAMIIDQQESRNKKIEKYNLYFLQ